MRGGVLQVTALSTQPCLVGSDVYDGGVRGGWWHPSSSTPLPRLTCLQHTMPRGSADASRLRETSIRNTVRSAAAPVKTRAREHIQVPGRLDGTHPRVACMRRRPRQWWCAEG